ncbi:hypothetical protein V5799_000240 [Amblyomma americanum]|uniref:Uncharacterized protein n=1 Tax=Amblyomma americanum TaxID=6943 RepID=A0AAQ4D3L9_AMBAM
MSQLFFADKLRALSHFVYDLQSAVEVPTFVNRIVGPSVLCWHYPRVGCTVLLVLGHFWCLTSRASALRDIRSYCIRQSWGLDPLT